MTNLINIENIPNIPQDKLMTILDNLPMIEMYIKALKEYVIKQLLDGINIPGYALKSGKKIRKFTKEGEEKLLQLLGDDAYEKSIIGVTTADKLLGKEIVKNLVTYVESKPTFSKENIKDLFTVVEA